MPFVVRADARTPGSSTPGVERHWILAPDRLSDGRLTVEVLTLQSNAAVEVTTTGAELAWFQVLDGVVAADGIPTDSDWICMLAGGLRRTLVATDAATVLLARVPQAAGYDVAVAAGLARRVDWSTEPVLDSEHDSRRRIYLASTGLWGTEAVKGELIIYPAGAVGAPHHHEGAEHFQLLLSGSGTAVIEDGEIDLHAGDLLYNLENEMHSFANRTDADMVFVEFFVPGANRTVWPPGIHVCGWNPTERDIKGRTAARQLAYHVHGQGDV